MGLLILQIIKWILLFIVLFLCIILGLLLLVLFTPICYRVKGRYDETGVRLAGKVSWFLCLIQLPFEYREKFYVRLKILGLTVYHSDRSGNKKKKEKNKTSDEKKRDENNTLSNSLSIEKPPTTTAVVKDHSSNDPTWVIDSVADHNPGNQVKHTEPEADNTTESSNKKNSLSERLRKIWGIPKGLRKRIQDFIHKIISIWQTAKDKKALFDHYYSLWKKDSTQITWSRAKRKFTKIVKSVLPRNWKLMGSVGFEDPSTTGQMMAGLGIAYPFIGNHILINPDFEEQRMELNGFARGWIVIGILLFQLISLFLNKHCISMIKMILNEVKKEKKSNQRKSNMQEVADDRQ